LGLVILDVGHMATTMIKITEGSEMKACIVGTDGVYNRPHT